MRLGFTGTRQGMAAVQQDALHRLVYRLTPRECHFGAAVGSDRIFYEIVHEICRWVTFHPSTPEQLAWSTETARETDHVHQLDTDTLRRNRRIVCATDMLIATPRLPVEEHRSGTWATIRYARKLNRPVYIVWPDGSVTEERFPARSMTN